MATASAVRKRLEELKQQFPTGLDYKIALDTSLFTLNSIDKVVHTFFEAVVLVVLVVFVFLQSLRATLIPILAVPVSIVGTFVGMHLLGFSINMLTMFGMILAIGLVVDDAIVVVESVEATWSTKGLSALEAAKLTMTQIAGALISIVLVLVAVFLPVAFLGGVTGKLYQQFAVTIAISMVISGIMALTLSPALAAIIIKAHHGEKKGFFRWFENGFERLRSGYVGVVARAIQALAGRAHRIRRRHRRHRRYVPRPAVELRARRGPGLFLRGDPGAGYRQPRSRRADHRTGSEDHVGRPAVQDVATVAGYSLLDGQIQNNSAVMFASLKPFDERKDASLLSFAALKRLNAQFSDDQGSVRLRAQPAVDSRHGHDGRLRVLHAESRLRRCARHGRCGRDVPRQGRAAARAAGRFDDLPARDPAIVRRSRPQQG